MTGLSAPTGISGAAIAGAIIPGAAAGVIAGEGTAGGAGGGGTAGGAANGAANCATANPAVITTEMAMITAAAPAAMMQTSVSELLLLPKVLKQPMPVRELIWFKTFENSAQL